jgi:hypothetical protein
VNVLPDPSTGDFWNDDRDHVGHHILHQSEPAGIAVTEPIIYDDVNGLPPEFRLLTWFRVYGTAVGLLALLAIVVSGIYFSPATAVNIALIALCSLCALFVLFTVYFRWIFLRRSMMVFSRRSAIESVFTFSAVAIEAKNASVATVGGPGWIAIGSKNLAIAAFGNIWVVANTSPTMREISLGEVLACEPVRHRFAYDQLQISLTAGDVITIALTAQSIFSVRGSSESEVCAAAEAIELARRRALRRWGRSDQDLGVERP